MKQQKATRKAWVELPKKVMERLDRLAEIQNRSRANLLAVIVRDAVNSPDSATLLGEDK